MTLPANPFDSIAPQAWIALFLAIVAWAPANYVWQHFRHERAPHDITQPPEDTSWKSRKHLFRSLAIVTILIAIGGFVFTPQAAQFAKSQWFVPGLLGAFGSYSIGTLVPGWRNRAIEPLVRGIPETYSRDTQPKRYWASMMWNGVFGVVMLVVSVSMPKDNTADLKEMTPSERSMFAAQGADDAIARGDPEAGIRLATESLRLDPSNREARRLRAEAYWQTGQRDLSIADDRILHPID